MKTHPAEHVKNCAFYLVWIVPQKAWKTSPCLLELHPKYWSINRCDWWRWYLRFVAKWTRIVWLRIFSKGSHHSSSPSRFTVWPWCSSHLGESVSSLKSLQAWHFLVTVECGENGFWGWAMTGDAVLPCSREPRLVLGTESCHIMLSRSSATWAGHVGVLQSAVLIAKCLPAQVPDCEWTNL